MRNAAGAFWLLDIIASYQPDVRLEPFQVGTLNVTEDAGQRQGLVTMYVDEEDDDGPSVKVEKVRQEIEFTDFPMAEIKLWTIDNGEGHTILLPSEH